VRRLTVSLVVAALAAATAAPASAHGGNPHYRSTVRAVVPTQSGLELRVLNYDDRLQMSNRTGKTIQVPGYDDEPYLRVTGDGRVEVNRRSPSYYLNSERYGLSAPPPQADSKAPPDWQKVSNTGRYEWHDHRIHYMSKTTPPQVKDKSRHTKVFDWKVPMTVDGQTAAIRGDLYWQPAASSSAPTGAIVAFGIFVLATGAFMAVVTMRRRRRG
jgi:hypothetical protein